MSDLFHVVRADGLVGVSFQVGDVRGVVGRGGGTFGFAAQQLIGCGGGWMVQTVVMQHGDHFLFDELLCDLEVGERLHGGGAEHRLVYLQGEPHITIQRFKNLAL